MQKEARFLEKILRIKIEKNPSERNEFGFSIELLPPKMGMFDRLFEILARRKKTVPKMNQRLRPYPVVNAVFVKIPVIPYRPCHCCA